MQNKVLIIESDGSLNLQLANTLSEGGFMAGRASSYHEALLQLVDFQPHLIILNETLPDSCGVEASSHLASVFKIPTILIGNDSTDEAWRKMGEANAEIYLRVPFDLEVLVARIKAILRRYEEHLYAY